MLETSDLVALEAKYHSKFIFMSFNIHSKFIIILIFATLKKPNARQLETVKALRCDVNLFSKLFIACQNRNLDLDTFFAFENQNVPPSLSATGNMRMCPKSDIVTVLLKKIQTHTTHCSPKGCSRHVYDGATLVHSHP